MGSAEPNVLTALRRVQDVLAEFVADCHGTRPETIDPDSTVTDYAVNSVQTLQLHGRLEDAFGFEIPASALFDYATVAALADHLDRQR